MIDKDTAILFLNCDVGVNKYEGGSIFYKKGRLIEVTDTALVLLLFNGTREAIPFNVVDAIKEVRKNNPGGLDGFNS